MESPVHDRAVIDIFGAVRSNNCRLLWSMNRNDSLSAGNMYTPLLSMGDICASKYSFQSESKICVRFV
jgi:hypothetical protein